MLFKSIYWGQCTTIKACILTVNFSFIWQLVSSFHRAYSLDTLKCVGNILLQRRISPRGHLQSINTQGIVKGLIISNPNPHTITWPTDGTGLQMELVYRRNWSTYETGLQTELAYKRNWSTDGTGLQTELVYRRNWSTYETGLHTELVYRRNWSIDGTWAYAIAAFAWVFRDREHANRIPRPKVLV